MQTEKLSDGLSTVEQRSPADNAAAAVVSGGPDVEGAAASTDAADALDLVDAVLEALESDELERAEELVEQLESPDAFDGTGP